MHRLRLLRALIWHLFPWSLRAHVARERRLDFDDLGFPLRWPGPVTVQVPPRHVASFHAAALVGIDPGRDDQQIDMVAESPFAGIDRSVAPPLDVLGMVTPPLGDTIARVLAEHRRRR